VALVTSTLDTASDAQLGKAPARQGDFVRKFAALLLLLALMLGASAPVADRVQQFAALRSYDARLATIGFRLVTANAALCDERQPGTGAVLHAIDQYDPAVRPAARQFFGFAAPVSVELVVAGSPAARAGVMAGDGVLAVEGAGMPAPTGGAATAATRDAALALVASQDPSRSLTLSLLRQGRARAATLAALPACRAAFELVLGPDLIAHSDGRIVQIGVRYLEQLDDEQLAAVVGHELAHIVLHHRTRLEAAGIHWGILGELGRSARLFRRTEDDADALGAVLMRNAGYDPHAAVAFWRRRQGALDGLSSTHASSKQRAAAIEAAIAAIPPDAPVPWVPPIIATRNEALR